MIIICLFSEQKPFSQANLMLKLVLPDEGQHRVIEKMLSEGACTSDIIKVISPDAKKSVSLLSKPEKTIDEY